MEKKDLLDRREFTVQSALAVLGGVTITVAGCGGGGSSNPTGSSTASSDHGGTISANHGHVATITSAQLAAGNAVTLTLQAADHNHTLALSAAEIVAIRNGQTVAKMTSNAATDGHQHMVTFAPGQGPIGPTY